MRIFDLLRRKPTEETMVKSSSDEIQSTESSTPVETEVKVTVS